MASRENYNNFSMPYPINSIFMNVYRSQDSLSINNNSQPYHSLNLFHIYNRSYSHGQDYICYIQREHKSNNIFPYQ